MQGIEFNTKEEFDALNEQINTYCRANVSNYNASVWCQPIIGLDGKYLMLGIEDARISGFDLGSFTIISVDYQNQNYFPLES